MSIVAVTGASGFLGRQVVERLLACGHEVHALGRRGAQAHERAGVRGHRVDLFDPAATRDALDAARAEGLVHLAWETGHGDYWSNPSNRGWIEASLRLVRDFRECGGRRAVFAGSSAEYDWSAAAALDEDRSPLRPISLYGRCKNELRERLEAWAPGAGVSWAWGRIFNMYGPFEKPERLVPRVIRALDEGRTLPFDDAALVRDFIHVEDAADAFAALYESEVQGVVNIASGDAVAVRELIGIIEALLERPGKVQFGAIRGPSDAPDRVVASVRRLRREVGWSPRRNLQEGLRETCEWWRSHACAGQSTLERNGYR